ncbi:MAG: hypothetical protein KTR14_00240 [Vampirovibrio sp.]|nr:hypothetical protein [Vampirovibrio sp.]
MAAILYPVQVSPSFGFERSLAASIETPAIIIQRRYLFTPEGKLINADKFALQVNQKKTKIKANLDLAESQKHIDPHHITNIGFIDFVLTTPVRWLVKMVGNDRTLEGR